MKAALAALAGAVAFLSASVMADETNIKLYTLDCGEVDMLDLGFFAKDGEFDGRQNKAGDSCYVIQHPKGTLLWDTGLPKSIANMPDGVKVPGFHLRVNVSIQDQLKQIGLSEKDIDFLSISHSHFDHSGNMNDFAGSTWLVHENEYAHMFSDASRASKETFAAYDKLENSKKITFTEDLDVFGDGSVVIYSMPGHTPGHTSLLVNLKNAGPVMLTGDLYHLADARELRTVPKFNTNADDTLKSMDRFEKIVKEKDARVIIQHEKADLAQLPKFPAYLD